MRRNKMWNEIGVANILSGHFLVRQSRKDMEKLNALSWEIRRITEAVLSSRGEARGIKNVETYYSS